jgi:hypothetical protein
MISFFYFYESIKGREKGVNANSCIHSRKFGNFLVIIKLLVLTNWGVKILIKIAPDISAYGKLTLAWRGTNRKLSD